MNIFDILFEIFPHLILGAGPFCVFKGMGTGKDSGKLLFKKIYSDGSLSITENSGTLDLTSTGGSSQPIDSCEIAFGSLSPGITSSIFLVCESEKTISGLGSVGTSPNRNYSGFNYLNAKDSLIVGGYTNYIAKDSYNSLIVGGFRNKFYGPGSYNQINSSIIGGNYQKIDCSSGSVFISSKNSYLKQDAYSTLINGYNNTGKNIGSSGTFLSGENSRDLFGTRNTILTSESAYDSQTNSSFYSTIFTNGSVHDTYYSSLLGFKNSTKLSKRVTNSGKNNIIEDSYSSTIINGISNYLSQISNKIFNSTIVNGKLNKIQECSTEGTDICNSIILHGYNSNLNSLKNNAILNGKDIKTIHKPSLSVAPVNSVLINGETVEIGGCNSAASGIRSFVQGNNSVLLSSSNGKSDITESSIGILGENSSIFNIGMTGSTSSLSIGPGINNSIFSISQATFSIRLSQDLVSPVGICNFNSSIITLQGNTCITATTSNSMIISFNCSCITTRSSGKNLDPRRINCSSVIIGNRSCILNGYESSIIAGKFNRIEAGCRSVIIGGYNNKIDGFVKADALNKNTYRNICDSVIIGGHNNSIYKDTNRSYTTVIIGGSFSTAGGAILARSSIIPSLDARCFSVWSRFTLTVTPGLTEQKCIINSICVCNGILISWT
jgi:hypothetical protein